jgi:CubicO group peptidase (beta-lactamase class C family)
MRKILFLSGLFFWIAAPAQTPAFISTGLDTFIQTGMQQWQVPALSIVIVKDGKVVARKGYGVKDVLKKDPVDENTLFFIASNSKLFTGTALAHLQYHKKLNLNDKITKYFPDYKLYDDLTTQQVTIRDKNLPGRFHLLEHHTVERTNHAKNAAA